MTRVMKPDSDGVTQFHRIAVGVPLAKFQDALHVSHVKVWLTRRFATPAVSQVGPLEITQVKTHRVIEHDIQQFRRGPRTVDRPRKSLVV